MEATVKYSGRLFVIAIFLVLFPFVQFVHAGDKTEVVDGFENYISDENFFTAMIPQDWGKDEDIILGRTTKEYGVILIGPRGREGTPVMITVLYYGDGKESHGFIKSAENFINLNSKPNGRQLVEKEEEYGEVKEITLAGRKAKKFDKKTFELISSSKKILIFKRFVVVPAAIGFYALEYEAPLDLAQKYESVFDKVINSFNPKVK
jgi:hypothetical protein